MVKCEHASVRCELYKQDSTYSRREHEGEEQHNINISAQQKIKPVRGLSRGLSSSRITFDIGTKSVGKFAGAQINSSTLCF